jgi:hypothetical protein
MQRLFRIPKHRNDVCVDRPSFFAISPLFTHPLLNAFSALTNSTISDSHVFRERTLFSQGRNSYSISVLLEQKSIASPDPEFAPDLPRRRNLPLASELCFFLRGRDLTFPCFIIELLTFSALSFLRIAVRLLTLEISTSTSRHTSAGKNSRSPTPRPSLRPVVPAFPTP